MSPDANKALAEKAAIMKKKKEPLLLVYANMKTDIKHKLKELREELHAGFEPLVTACSQVYVGELSDEQVCLHRLRLRHVILFCRSTSAVQSQPLG